MLTDITWPSVSMWSPIKMVISLFTRLSFLWPLLVSIFASCLNQWSSNYNQNVLKSYFSAVEQAQFLLVGYIEKTLKSYLNNFKWWRVLIDHDDVEGEEGAAILVQHRLLLHRLPWASLMADAWFPTPFSTAESSTTPAPLLHTLPTIKEIHKWYKSQIQNIQNTQIHILNGRELHHPRTSTPRTLCQQSNSPSKYSSGANFVPRERNSESTI